MSTARNVAALISAVSLLAAGTIAYGQTAAPGQADFDRCNRQAQAAIGGTNPSASPSTGPSITPGTSGPAATAAPSVGSPSTPGPSGSATAPPTAGSPTTPGTTSITPAPITPAPGSGSTGANAPSSSDPLLRGMAAAGLSDPAYQQAYRDCMQSK